MKWRTWETCDFCWSCLHMPLENDHGSSQSRAKVEVCRWEHQRMEQAKTMPTWSTWAWRESGLLATPWDRFLWASPNTAQARRELWRKNTKQEIWWTHPSQATSTQKSNVCANWYKPKNVIFGHFVNHAARPGKYILELEFLAFLLTLPFVLLDQSKATSWRKQTMIKINLVQIGTWNESPESINHHAIPRRKLRK